MGGKGGSAPDTVTSTTTQQPWAGQAGPLYWLYGMGQGTYPYSDVTPWSPETQAGMGLTTARAMTGSPLLPAAQAQTLGTLGGAYSYGGPEFNRAFEAASNQIIPAVESRWEGAGRFGGGLGRAAETQALGDAFAGLYNAERQRQMGAAAMAPGLAEADYSDLQKLLGVGASREAMAQQQASMPWTNLQRAAQIIYGGGSPGGTTTATGPNTMAQTSSPLMGALGGGMLGGQLAGALGGGVGATSTLLGGSPVWSAAGATNPFLLPLIAGGALLGSKG